MTIAKVSLDVTEAVVRRCSVKKLFLEISQTSQENNCENTFIKKETLTQVFSYEFCEISRNTSARLLFNDDRREGILREYFFPGPRPLPSAPIYIWRPRSSSCIYRSRLVRIGNNNNQSLHQYDVAIFIFNGNFREKWNRK